MEITKKVSMKATTLRVWLSTRAKLKAIAKHYQVPMTRLLDQVADNIIQANSIPFDK